jgi:hypothetical protein
VFFPVFFVSLDFYLDYLETVDFLPRVLRLKIVDEFYSSSPSSSSSSSSISMSINVSAATIKFSMTNCFSFPFLNNHSENSIRTSTISTDESFFNNSMALL